MTGISVVERAPGGRIGVCQHDDDDEYLVVVRTRSASAPSVSTTAVDSSARC
jgi:hypothetical protein